MVLMDDEKESKVSWLLLEEDTEDSKETKEIKEYKAEFILEFFTNELKIIFKKTNINNHLYILKDYLVHLLLHDTPPEII
ncbi:hypothetical protein BWK63_05260 [Flavobacterium covae]|nr:hypothetical protein BWK63_05260 [Flavobacterium covae]OWP86916.1 hypothetical protein BWK60_06405 [Flavobacterium covae]POR22598.1 hypothetical protein BWK57_05425 [Flavobacterium columnare]